MDLDAETLDHLSGRTFSSAHRFALGRAQRAPHRIERVLELCRGRRVLHVGCCDHLELVRSKVAQGNHLHSLLCAAAERCVGMDINAVGVAELRALGFADTHLPDEVPDLDYDVCLLADVIEHVGDVVAFLASMRRYRFAHLVVVTPNAFRLRNFLSSGELVNTDHRYWFSPYTLCKVVVDAGYKPEQVELCHGDPASFRGRWLARALDLAPKYRDTLLVSAAP